MDCLNLGLIDLKLVLQGTDCQQRWPCVKIVVDQKIIYDGIVSGVNTVGYKSAAESDQKKCTVDIEYYNKTDQDTQIDKNGEIISNQLLSIKEFWVNGVDIVKTGAIHQDIGCYTMNLDTHKYEYFVKQGINTCPTTNTHMFENGVWHVEIELPLLSTLSNKNSDSEPWEQVDVESIVKKLYSQLIVCEDLEQTLNSKNQ